MNTLDVVILVLVASLAFGGYRVGFLARAASWIGLGAGLFLAVRTLPAIVGSLGDAEPSTRLLVSTAVLVAAGAAGQALGLFLGHWVRSALPPGGLRTLDRAAGGLAGGLVVLVALWLILPSMAEVQGYPARLARTSTVAGLVHEVFPPAPDAMQTLRRLVEESGFPRVFEDLRPAPDPGAPPEDLGLRPEVAAQVSASTVQVRGQACSRVQEGSGFAAGTDLVVTNAHVVAGEQPGATEVLRPDGRRLAATVALFDPARDLAVLRVNGLGQRALVVGDAEPGDEG
ncbi:MAG: CvpA family protein, partial [Acidimicrobiales bacterium]